MEENNAPNLLPPQTPVTMNNKIHQGNKKNVFIPLIGIIILFALLFFFRINPDQVNKQNGNTSLFSPAITTVPQPTSFPFQELTIPYLQAKTYSSTLGEREIAYDGASYTAYLTNYISEGLKINGLLTMPKGVRPNSGWPGIVFIHGYIPPTVYETNGDAYRAYVDYLASNGFVVFKIDLRGHGNSEGEPGGGYYGSDYVTDALNAYAALQTSDFVNPNKIGMWGHSMAGNILMRSFAAKKDIPAVVIWAGAVYTYEDQRKYGINDQSYRPPQTATPQQNRRRELFEKHGSPSAQSLFWQQVAPTNYLHDLKGAVAIHHAVDDAVVDIGYSRDLNALLDKTQIQHELYEYQFGGHNITGSSFNLAMQRTVDFFQKHLTLQ